MTPRENFQRMMKREGPAWLPMALPCTQPVQQMIEQKIGTLSKLVAPDFGGAGGPAYTHDTAGMLRVLEELGFKLPANGKMGAYGRAHLTPPRETLGAAWHLTEMAHPLEVITSVEQLEKLPWPVVDDPALFAGIEAATKKTQAAGLAAHGGMECTVFESAWNARGMDNLFTDLIDGNGIGEWLLEWHTKRSTNLAAAYAKAGVDVIGLGDDVGTQRGMMMSVPFWREHLKGRLKRVIDAIRANQPHHIWVKYHSDGDVRDIIPELIEIGVDILNPVQSECMSPVELAKQYKDRLRFWGMIGTQTTMPYGTTEDVRRAVGVCERLAREGAGVVVAPTHVLEPDVPWENISALVRAIADCRLPIAD